MYFCYSDESGMGKEPITTMVGIIVNSYRMHITKQDWDWLLDTLSEIPGKRIAELKASDFYAGNGVWRGLNGEQRARVINAVCEWLINRRHQIVYSSILKSFITITEVIFQLRLIRSGVLWLSILH